MNRLIDLESALVRVVEALPLPCREIVGLERAMGRVVAEPVQAGEDVPQFNRSTMDGFAVAAALTRGASERSPVALSLVGESAAGKPWPCPLGPGQAVRVSTGAAIPQGADAVVRLEDARERDGRLEILAPVEPGLNVGLAGEDVSRGKAVLRPGQLIGPPEMGVLAALGVTALAVYARPVVALLCTGSELVEVEEQPGPGQIRNSNRYALSAAVVDAGGVPWFLGTVPDSVSEITEMIRRARGASLILTTGGASVGRHDLTLAACEALGARILFWRVAVKPGTPTLAAAWDGRLIIGLSGNPAAAITGFDLLVRPAIRRLLGMEGPSWSTVRVKVDQGFGKISSLMRLLRARIYIARGRCRAELLAGQKAGILSTMIGANGYVMIPGGQRLERGQQADALLTRPLET